MNYEEHTPHTAHAADRLSPTVLTYMWLSRTRWDDQPVAGLAVASGLQRKFADLERAAIHRAVLLGADVNEVADATGHNPMQIRGLWAEWADMRRAESPPAMAKDEYDRVWRILMRGEQW